MSDQVLGLTHRVGISYRFGGFFASSQATPPLFSPLGTQSVTKFNLTARTKADAATWNLSIVDKSNQEVRRFSGKGSPPAHIMWDGKDENGLSLADGAYRYQLVVVDAEGRLTQGRARTDEIMPSGPQGDVPVVVSEQY
jgi:flagellar hook assembly protein FlgD